MECRRHDAPSLECKGCEIKRLHARVAELEAALRPFAHPDLRLRLGGNSPRDGDSAIVFQRNKAILMLRDFDAAKQALLDLKW